MEIESTGTAISPDQGDQTLVSGAFSAREVSQTRMSRAPQGRRSRQIRVTGPSYQELFRRTRMSRAPSDPSDRVGVKVGPAFGAMPPFAAWVPA